LSGLKNLIKTITKYEEFDNTHRRNVSGMELPDGLGGERYCQEIRDVGLRIPVIPVHQFR
jgi:hypothetical protein